MPRPFRFSSLLAALVPLLLTLTCWLSMSTAVSAHTLRPTAPILALFSFAGTRPQNLGTQDGKLTNCPSTPNCVNSQTADAAHTIAPLQYTSAPEKAFADLKQTIQALPRTKIITANDQYLYAEFTSQIMGFVDDVEFYLDKNAGVIHVRSASRLGESDLGVNRQRIESIRASLKTLGDLA